MHKMHDNSTKLKLPNEDTHLAHSCCAPYNSYERRILYEAALMGTLLQMMFMKYNSHFPVAIIFHF